MNAVTYRNLDIVSITVGCSGYGSKSGFLHIHLSDGKIVRFNQHEKELEMLKDILNGSAKVGIKKKRKYYYLEKVIANVSEQTITK